MTKENLNTNPPLVTENSQKETYAFPSTHKIKSEKTIQSIFENGFSFYEQYFKCVYTKIPLQKSKLQLCVSVPKSRIKLAVNRNYIKRITREAWRKNKNVLEQHLEHESETLAVMIIFQKREKPTYTFIEKNIQDLIFKLIKISKNQK